MNSVLEFAYKPSAWQQRFHMLTTNEALGAGAAGPGKSFCLLMDPIFQMQLEHYRCTPEYEGHSVLDPEGKAGLRWGHSLGCALHLRRTYKQLRQTMDRSHRIFLEADPNAHWSSAEMTWTFSSGFKLEFGHCKNTNDWESYYSNEYSHIAFDELNQFEKVQYDQITSRLRSSDDILMRIRKIRAMSNPVVVRDRNDDFSVANPFWVRDRFVKPHPQGDKVLRRTVVLPSGKEIQRTFIYLPAKLSDNPNKNFAEQYEEELADKPAYIRKALLEGDWFVTIGSYYGDAWNPERHICQPFKIPSTWRRWRALDWGYQQPGVCLWFAMDDENCVVVEREYTFQKKHPKEVAERIKEIETQMGLWDKKRDQSKLTGPADTQLWEERGDAIENKALVFQRHGVMWMRADKRSRAANAMRLTARLRQIGNKSQPPGICFFRTCARTIQNIMEVQRDPKDPETPEDTSNDHWHDTLLYGNAYAEVPGRIGRPNVSNRLDLSPDVDDDWSDQDDGIGYWTDY